MPSPNPAAPSLSKADLQKIKTILHQAIKLKGKQTYETESLNLLNLIVETVQQLKVTVDFDHEERLRAIEDYLSER